MPRYDVLLEAQDGSGHFRRGSVEAKDKADAQRQFERKELEMVLFQLNATQIAELCERQGVKSLDDLPRPAKKRTDWDGREEFKTVRGQDRGLLAVHYQEQPYKVVEVKLSLKGKG